jgi:aminoglycoside 3-N-acetyltransferase
MKTFSAARFKALKKKFMRLLRPFRRRHTERTLSDQLLKAGLAKNDTLVVHGSLSKLGNIDGGAPTVIRALLTCVGEKGNLVFPSFSYTGTMRETVASKDYIFNAESTPSVVGRLTEEFRKWPGARRSLHPTHSYSALGPDSDKITQGHFAAATNFGPGTPLAAARELGGKLVGLGIGIGPVTFYHSVEDFFPELFPAVYLSAPAQLRVLLKDEVVNKTLQVHNPETHRQRIDKVAAIEKWFDGHLTRRGILHKARLGDGTMWWMNMQELFDELLALQSQGISIYQVPGL